MSRSAPSPAGPAPGRSASRPARARRQVGLRTVFLLVAALAVWMAYGLDRRQIARLERQIARDRPLVRELVIEDEEKIAVVELEPLWMEEYRWEVYLPEGRYRLCLATREIGGIGLAPEVSGAPIGGGRHLIAIEQRRNGATWRIVATCDGTRRVEAEQPESWHSAPYIASDGPSSSRSSPADRPAVLFRRNILSTEPGGRLTLPIVPAEGILLWIEPAADSTDSAPPT